MLVVLIIPIVLFASVSTPAATAQTNATSTLANSTSFTPVQNATGLPSQEGFSVTQIATNFSAPHNILYGPDGVLWITERTGKSITRVDPDTGEIISSVPMPDVHQSGGQDGLMGMAFDPDFNTTRFIYVAYTYDADSGDELDRQTKISRFTYEPQGAAITNKTDLISGLSASVDHNSGRMIF
jgi:glucose/arabinose dehydrogenase